MHKEGIDFIIVSYCKHDYVRLCVESIKKFVDIPHTIHIVVNYLEKEKEMEIHQEMFKDSDNVFVLEGCDQSSTLDISRLPRFVQLKDRIGKIDNCKVASGSYYGTWATNIGIRNGDRKYICVLDQDTILLDSCMEDLMELSEKYAFISNRWDPGSIFQNISSNEWDDGIARVMLCFSKRELYDDIEAEKYVEKGIWQDSPWNCDYRDNACNLTWYAKQKNKEILILTNSYRDNHREDNGLWKEHILPIADDYTEQAWLNEKPILFHHGRGGFRYGMDPKWVNAVEDYLEIKNV